MHFFTSLAMSPASCRMATRVSGQPVLANNLLKTLHNAATQQPALLCRWQSQFRARQAVWVNRWRFERRRVIYKSTLLRAQMTLVAAHEHDDNGL
jgi:hypothetical protein